MLKSLAYTDAEIAEHKAEHAKYSAVPDGYEGPKYPWGLEIRLENSSLEKLGKSANDFKVGSEIMMQAMVRVSSISSNETERGGKNECVTLCITQADFGDGKKSDAEQATALYGETKES